MHSAHVHDEHIGEVHSHNAAYWKVFAGLAVFTVVELGIPFVLSELRPLMIVLLMAVAAIKAMLVALYYMHLKFEKVALGALAAAPLILVAMLILLIMADVSFVDQAGWTFTQSGTSPADAAAR